MKKLPTQLPARRSFLRLALGTGAGAVVGGGLLAACGGGDPEPQVADGREQPLGVATTCTPAIYPVVTRAWQGGGTVATMSVTNTSTHLDLSFVAPPNCAMSDIHVWVGTDLALVPTNEYGVNAFAFPHHVVPSAPGESAQLSIPLASISLLGDPCKQPLYILAKVQTPCGFGYPSSGSTYSYMDTPYAAYQLCGLDCTVLQGCETAFAKGDWVFASERRANPESLASLGLARNRWGWAIRRDSNGTTTHNIYAGAGLNDISKGTLVGTVSIGWDGTTATVTYALVPGVVMTEAHLYAGSTAPATIAPGQYGNNASFLTPVSSHTFTVPLSGSVAWFVVHAVVC